MPSLSQRYISALAELNQFQCVVDDRSTLTHVLTGVQVSPETTDEQEKKDSFLRLTFPGGHTVKVIASMYFELQLAEDAAHNLHAVHEGSGRIHKRAAESLDHLSWKYDLRD